jgi:hypothetical protein
MDYGPARWRLPANYRNQLPPLERESPQRKNATQTNQRIVLRVLS